MNPETYPHTSTQLIVDRGAKASQWRKGCLLSKWCWSQWTPMGIKMNYTLNLTSYTKINSKWKMELKSSGPRVGRVLRLDTKKGTIGNTLETGSQITQLWEMMRPSTDEFLKTTQNSSGSTWAHEHF